MRKIALLGVVLAASLTVFVTEASSAVVCGRGIHRAGCVATNGAAIGGRTYYRYRGGAYRGGAVVHRGGAAIHRRGFGRVR